MARDEADEDATWARWMAAAQAGDQAAYGRLLRAVVPFVSAAARRRLRAPEAVADVVQDTLLSLHRMRHTYDPSRPFKPWLGAIAVRRTVDHLRRRGRVDRLECVDDSAAANYADPRADHSFHEGERSAEVRACLASLPEGQRRALELVKVRELSLREAAAITGQSEGALKVAVHRGLHALRARFLRTEALDQEMGK
ncbi:MAG: sigma-70 family RNA polymerase sigma factor [Gammaproteobacteria bacterium]